VRLGGMGGMCDAWFDADSSTPAGGSSAHRICIPGTARAGAILRELRRRGGPCSATAAATRPGARRRRLHSQPYAEWKRRPRGDAVRGGGGQPRGGESDSHLHVRCLSASLALQFHAAVAVDS
jgi:hypothetical protein